MTHWFLSRGGLVVRNGRIIAKIPSYLSRPLVWLYWDVWWGSWLSWRLTTNPRTTYLVALTVAAATIALRR